ncbi:tape measure protein [Bifidobacterium catenulatum]|uniref:tape measure protein n=1 Tax=Bifidobacterium catenulatum TaxID=1686 RepID=UPI003D3513C8
MATRLAQAYVEIVPSMKGVGNAITKAFGGASESVGRSEGMKLGGGISAGIGAKLGAVAGVASNVAGRVIDAFKDLSGEIVSASDSAQKFGSTLQFAGVSTKQIKALTKSTQDYADKTVYDLNDIRNTTSQLAANGVPNYAKLAEAAGNLNAVAGGSSETFKSVAMVLTQTAGAGKLTTENWNQLSDAIPGASGKLQEAMKKNGAYTGNFRDAMAKGEITADEFNKAIMQLGMTDAAKEAATSTTTIEGSLGNLEAAAVKAGMTVLDSVKPMVTGAMNGVSDALTVATPVIQNAIQGTIKWFQDLYRQLQQNGALTTFKQVWDSLVGVVKKASGIAVNWMKSLPPGGAANAIQAVADALQWIIDNKGLVLTALAAIGGGFATLKTITTVTSLINSVKTAVIGFSTAVKSAGGGIKLLSAALGTGPWGLLATAIAVVVAGLVYFFTQTETGRQLWASFTSWLAGVWTSIQAAWTAAWTAIGEFLSSACDGIKSAIQTALDFISNLWTSVWTAVGSFASAIWNGIRSVVSNAINGVRNVVSSVLGAIQSVWSNIWNGVRNIVSTVWGGITGVVSNAINGVRNIVGGIGGIVRGAVSGAGSWLVNAGHNIIQGLINGITGMVGSLYSSITRALSGLVDKAKNALGIHSPSRVFRDQIGVMVGRGMALGIDDSASIVGRSMDSLVSSMSLDGMTLPDVGFDMSGGSAVQAVGATYVTQTFNYPAIAPTSISTQQKLQTAAMPQW